MRHEYEITFGIDGKVKDINRWIDWLIENIPNEDWNLDYSMNYNRILFKKKEDATAFKLRFKL